MVQRARGYSRVRSPSGQVGYVGTEDIAPLDASEIAAEDAQRLAAAAAAAPPGALTSPIGVAPAAGGPRYTIPPEAGRIRKACPRQDPNPTPKPPATLDFPVLTKAEGRRQKVRRITLAQPTIFCSLLPSDFLHF